MDKCLNLTFAILLCHFTLLQFITCQIGHGNDRPTVTIENGKLEGIYLESRGGRTFAAFMGIPYADAPEKFELAKPTTPWTGARDASKFGPVCVQFDIRLSAVVGHEDCLFINVFTPELAAKRNLPVLVFIHGGGFQFGNSDENGPHYLMDEDVVLVTFNYRLGAYGFLSTGDGVIPGNLGMKDQVLALEWVRKNIERFGGNPDAVTIFGESAGGVSVGLHIVSPLSQGLFQHAICISGTGLDDWATMADPMPLTIKFANHLNCPISSSIEIRECLKTKTYEEICTQLPSDIPFWHPAFTPSIEAEDIPNAFLTASPREVYGKGEFAKIPLLVTVNEEEGLVINSAAIMQNPELIHWINTNWMPLAPKLFQYEDKPGAEQGKISNAIHSYYFGNKDPIISEETFPNLTNVYSDTFFIFPSREAALVHGAHVPTYAAVLSIKGIWSQIFGLGYTEVMGMGHADDLQYYFSDVRYPQFVPNSDTFVASQRITRLFANFAKFGKPSMDKGGMEWEPVSSSEVESRTLEWMYVRNRDEEVISTLLEKRMKFWDTMLKPTIPKKKGPHVEL